MSKTAQQRWRERNPEKARENCRKWAAKNRKQEQERAMTYRKQRGAPGKAEHAASMKRWRKDNPRAAKNADLKKSYGITVDQYERLLAEQNGCCAACHGSPGQRALAVDHCHESGLVRGLLCHPCNTALGLLRECPNRMNALRDYINNFAWLK